MKTQKAVEYEQILNVSRALVRPAPRLRQCPEQLTLMQIAPQQLAFDRLCSEAQTHWLLYLCHCEHRIASLVHCICIFDVKMYEM
jgi:hypothetical protein